MMSEVKLSGGMRNNASGRPFRVFLVRVGADIAGFVSSGGDGHVFGYVLTDADADNGSKANGHTTIGYCLGPCQESSMAARVAEEWSRTGASALRGAGIGDWPLVRVAGRDLTACGHCNALAVSEEHEDGRGAFGYCHDCHRSSDR